MNSYREFDNYLKEFPTKDGYFGEFGGAFLPPELEPAFKEADDAYEAICHSAQFINELRRIRKEFQGRPTPVTHLERLSDALGGKVQLYAKREDLNHSGAHKLNHCMGEALLAKYMGKKKVIAETGAGQHGVALATAAAYFGLECDIYMGTVDIKKQAPNVARMKILGAKVVPVTFGAKTLKEAVDEAFEYLGKNNDVFYLIGSAVGPAPYPEMVKEFQKIIGEEAKSQILELENKLPKAIVACVGGGSNSIGLFTDFVKEKNVEIFGVEGAGLGVETGKHAAAMQNNTIGIMHGMKTFIMQDESGKIKDAYSISAGLDYPGIGPEHAYLKSIGRVKYDSITDKEAVVAFKLLCRLEGIIPALESAHAVAYATKAAQERPEKSILVCLSGRGDKDIDFIVNNYGTGEDYLK